MSHKVLTVDVDMDKQVMRFRVDGVPIEGVELDAIVGPVVLTVSMPSSGSVTLLPSAHNDS